MVFLFTSFNAGCDPDNFRCYNKYLCAERNIFKGIPHSVVANREEAKEWEQWDLINLDGKSIAIKSSTGRYLSVSNDGSTVSVVKGLSVNEKFELVPYNN